MSYANPWTTEEIELLKKYYPAYGRHVGKWPVKIDRTVRAISKKASELKIYQRGDGSLNWNERELKLLKKYFYRYGRDTTRWPEPIDRSPDAVALKARSLGLISTKAKKTKLDDNQIKMLANAWRLIAKNLGVDPYDLVRDLCYLRQKKLL